MAGAGHKLWSAGDVVAASGSTDINTALLEQIVGVYANTAARDAAFGGAGEPTLAEGMFCYITGSTDQLQVYNGSAWVAAVSTWTAFTPAITFGGSAASLNVNVGAWSNVGDTLMVETVARADGAQPAGQLAVDFSAIGEFSELFAYQRLGYGALYDNNLATSHLVCPVINNADGGEVFLVKDAGTAGLSNTYPFTWAANDELHLTIIGRKL